LEVPRKESCGTSNDMREGKGCETTTKRSGCYPETPFNEPFVQRGCKRKCSIICLKNV
jgi:hypothetical protein